MQDAAWKWITFERWDDGNLKLVQSPYEDGEQLVAMPAITLDAALIHMNRADLHGNGQFLGPDLYFDDLFCMAAKRRFMTCEKIVPTQTSVASVRPLTVSVPFHCVSTAKRGERETSALPASAPAGDQRLACSCATGLRGCSVIPRSAANRIGSKKKASRRVRIAHRLICCWHLTPNTALKEPPENSS